MDSLTSYKEGTTLNRTAHLFHSRCVLPVKFLDCILQSCDSITPTTSIDRRRHSKTLLWSLLLHWVSPGHTHTHTRCKQYSPAVTSGNDCKDYLYKSAMSVKFSLQIGFSVICDCVCVCLRECFSSSSRKHRSCREIINDTSDNILAAASRGSSSSSAWRAGWRGRARKSISRAEVLKARDEDDVAGFVQHDRHLSRGRT